MQDASATSPTVVLVHGAWADASSWRRVILLLLDAGAPVVAVQNPTTSLAADVAATRQVLDAIDGPVVLVGHSWGGAVITEAGNDPKVSALVYVAAFAPNSGGSVGDLVGAHPAPPALREIQDDGKGFLKLSREGWVNDVAQDLPKAEARVLAVLQPPLPSSTFSDRITNAAWHSRPCWYVVSSKDRVVDVNLQRECAVAMDATTTVLEAGHLSLLSQPQSVAEVIIDAFESIKSSAPA